MSRLTKIVKRLTMNRVTLLGCSLVTGGLAGVVVGFAKNDPPTAVYSAVSIIAGVTFLGMTYSGRETYKAYEKTKVHIQYNKGLNKEFVDLKTKLYCDRQGVYMAAKEFGLLEDYKKAREGKRVIIPNF